MGLLLEELTGKTIKAYFNVFNSLGYGFLEKVYENAMCLELSKIGLSFSKQHPITVNYCDQKVGSYYADILVADQLIVEIKAAESLCDEHECQLINYLRATDLEVGLLLNFGKKPEFRRKVFTNDQNKSAQIKIIR